MRSVSFQGLQITRSERATLELRQRIQAATKSPLAEQVQSALAVSELRKEKGIPAERLWSVDSVEKGTPWLGDAFGFH